MARLISIKLKMLYSIITTIQKPTASVLGLVDKLNEVGGKLIVAGDKKGPASYEAPSSEWRVASNWWRVGGLGARSGHR